MKSFESATLDYESEHLQEQTPEEFINSLKIFDSYVDVTPQMASRPEYKMTFDKNEQELAEGIRGMLEQLAADAMDDGSNVTIGEMFDSVDRTLLTNEDMDATTRDELLLVATKMRYNLQVRFQKEENELLPTGKALDEDLLRSYAALGALLSKASRYTTFEKPQSDNPNAKFDHPPIAGEGNEYRNKARDLIDEQTGGRAFSELTRKEQGEVSRRLARELHPDIGGDPELYKQVTSLTTQEKNK